MKAFWRKSKQETSDPAGTAQSYPRKTPSEQNAESWSQKLTKGLSKTATQLGDGISGILSKKTLDDAALSELEDLLISADLGPQTAMNLVESLRGHKFENRQDENEIIAVLSAKIVNILQPCAHPLNLDMKTTPQVVLFVGVNGTGKTTTIGKLAKHYTDRGHKVMLAAGDTFRAAAVEQLHIWGERTGANVISGAHGADAASVVYRALEEARREAVDVVFIDTAGRLHNKSNLIAELQKIVRVIGKACDGGPHHTILTLDATTGQNAFSQVEVFRDMVNISGLVVTKLDGSARGGVVVGLADRFALPIHAIGVGEGADDLKPFSAEDYASALLGQA